MCPSFKSLSIEVFSACSKLVFSSFFLFATSFPLFCENLEWLLHTSGFCLLPQVKSSRRELREASQRQPFSLAYWFCFALWVECLRRRLCSFTLSSAVQSVPYLESLWPCRPYYSWRLCQSVVGRTIWPCVKNDLWVRHDGPRGSFSPLHKHLVLKFIFLFASISVFVNYCRGVTK